MGTGGLSFNEVMNGQISFNKTEAQVGYESPGTIGVSLHAFVDMEDMDSFFDNGRRADLSARVTMPVKGGQFLGAGDFVLFGVQEPATPDKKRVRTMAYTMRLTRGSQEYEMRGHKIIRPGWPWQVWRATTKMYVTLHEVPSAAGEPGPVVAAGVLRLTLGSFLRQLGTMRPSGDVGLVGKVVVVSRYFGFFGWSLVRSYLLREDW